MSKFIDRAITLLDTKDMDGLQAELHDLEKAWRTCNGIRNSLQENNKDLVERNNKLALDMQELREGVKRTQEMHDANMSNLQQQMANVQVSKQVELQGLVEENVRLRTTIRQLEQDLRRAKKAG